MKMIPDVSRYETFSGVLEYWSVGVMVRTKRSFQRSTPLLHYSITPFFSYSSSLGFVASPIFSVETKLPFKNSRLNLAMFEIEISLGQTASHSL